MNEAVHSSSTYVSPELNSRQLETEGVICSNSTTDAPAAIDDWNEVDTGLSC